MSAIPFIISDDFNSLKIDRLHRGTAHSHLVQLIQYRIGHYRNMYDRLLSDRGLPSIINDRSEGVEGLTRQIYNQLTR